MVQWQTESKRKRTGGIRRSVNARDKKLFERGGVVSETKLGQEKRVVQKGMGATTKSKLLQSKKANLVDDKGKTSKVEIITVKGNKANKLFVRRNIMTKGAVVEVKHGSENRLASVTNRPGQSGSIELKLLPLGAEKEFSKKPQESREKQEKAVKKPEE
jgi:small subunit ribosomal protein S8e